MAGPPVFVPVSDTVVAVSQTIWSAPAKATGFFWKYTTILSVEVLQEPLVFVAVKVNVIEAKALSVVLGV